MAEAEGGELRAAIEKVQVVAGRRRYGSEVKRRVVEYVLEREAEGVASCEVSRELGLLRQTLRRWQREAEKRESCEGATVFRRVALGGESPVGLGRGVVVHGPRGLRIEGLTQRELVAILRALG